MSAKSTIGRVATAILLVLGLLLASNATKQLKTDEASISAASVERVGFPVGDCAAIAAGTTIGALGLVGSGYVATVAGTSSLFFGTTAAAFHAAVAGVVWAIKDPAKNCVQHVGNSTSMAICNASHFSPWDPRGIAARTIVRFATKNEYSRC